MGNFEEFLRIHLGKYEIISKKLAFCTIDFLLLCDLFPNEIQKITDSPCEWLKTMGDYFDFYLKERGEEIERVNVRLHNIPIALSNIYLYKIPKSSQANKLVAFSGIVTRVSTPKMFIVYKKMECSKCRNSFVIEYDVSQNLHPKPLQCPGKGRNGGDCNFIYV
jgi:DNA replicative helicase MCM subunit Mcm2 (Cdc46/Mcm family)